jgi:Putative beta-barrel porin 2
MKHTPVSAMPVLFLVVACLAPARPAHAQTQVPETIESMPIHVGPVGLRPSLSITSAGQDSNVFNDADNPQEDLTATIVPRLVARFRARRLTFSYGGATDVVYFRKFKDEGSVNSTTDVRVDASLGRLQPYASSGWVDTKDRMNAEVDIRAPRTQRAIAAGTRLLLASRTALVFNARRFDLDFDQGIQFNGSELSRSFNSRTDSVDAGVQLLLTPLTTFSVTTSLQRDRFDSAPERNADTVRIMPALQFDPTSLIRGTVAVGYRRFRPLSAALPDYSGLMVQVAAGYTLLERTKFDLDLTRDVQYSYEDLEPYYLSTGARLTITHQLVGPVDLQGIGGHQNLGYRRRFAEGEGRRDEVQTFGAGAGYRLRAALRLGVNWEVNRRLSEVGSRRYERQRIYASLTYGS